MTTTKVYMVYCTLWSKCSLASCKQQKSFLFFQLYPIVFLTYFAGYCLTLCNVKMKLAIYVFILQSKGNKGVEIE